MKVPPARVPNSFAVTAQRRVLIVDDHPIVRQGLRRMIEPEPDLVVCGEVQTEREARAAIRALAPDVVIVDISLAQGDGLELVRDVHAQRPELPMLVLSMHDELIYAERLLAAGASGYIMKQAASDQLLIALRKVLVGETYLSESLAGNLGRSEGFNGGGRLGSGSHRPAQQPGAAGFEPHRAGVVLAGGGRGPGVVGEDGGDPPAELEAQAQPGDQCPASAVRHQLVRQPQHPARAASAEPDPSGG